MVLIVGVPVNVPPVLLNILYVALFAVVPVPFLGMRYDLVYVPDAVVDSLIFVQPENMEL